MPGAAAGKGVFGTNWVAQAEHGGFYQALADGTTANTASMVSILQADRTSTTASLLPVGRIELFHEREHAAVFDAVEQNIPTLAVALCPEEPQVFIAIRARASKRFEDLSGSRCSSP